MNKKNVITFAIFLACLLAVQCVQAASDLAYLTEVTGTNFLPSTIRAGDVVSMAVSVKDRGTMYSIVDLNGTLDVGNQFEPVELNDNIPLILAGATQTLVFKFRVKQDTLTGYYPVFLAMTYTRNGEAVKETQTILVPVSKTEKNVDVTVDPRVINPGNQTNIFFTLKNIGGTPISNISFSWYEKSNLILPLGSDNKRYVSILEAGKEEQVSYVVAADPNITPGIYSLDINLAFTSGDSNGLKSQNSQVGIIVGGTTDFEVSAETSSGQISLSIANIGSNNAAAVVVKIPVQQGIRIQGSSTAILGNLNKGDYTLATFQTQSLQSDQTGQSTQQTQSFNMNQQFQQGQQADSNFFRQQVDQNRLFSGALQVEIDYTDTTGERQAVKKTVQLSSLGTQTGLTGLSARGSNQFSFVPWVLLVVFAGAAICINRFKAKKGWKQLAVVIAIIVVLFLAVIFLLNADLLASVIAAIASIVLLAIFFRKSLIKPVSGEIFSKSKKGQLK